MSDLMGQRELLMLTYLYERNCYNRHFHVLKWLYNNKDSCETCNSDLLHVYHEIDPDDPHGYGYSGVIDDLMVHGLIKSDETYVDCFYSITHKGMWFVDEITECP